MLKGDCHTALQTLEATPPENGAERLSQGWCYFKNGEFEKSLAPLQAQTKNDGVYYDYGQWVLAQSLFSLKRYEQAAQTLGDLQLPGENTWKVPLYRGKALVLAGKSLDARPGLRDLLSGPGGIEARYWLARGGEDRSETTAAIGTYRRVWTDGVRGQWDEEAANRLKTLGVPVPDHTTEIGRSLIQRRITSLKAEHQYSNALKLLQVLHQHNPVDTKEEWLTLARARFKARDYPSSVKTFEKALGLPKEAVGGANDLFNYALSIARTGDYDRATIVYRRVMKQHPRSKRADFASFKIGYMEYDRREFSAANREFTRHIDARPDSKYLDEALWFLGLCHWLDEDLQNAGNAWTRLKTERRKSALVPAAKYWLARIAARSGDETGAKAGYEALLKDHPSAGHSWYAARRLGKTFPQQERFTAPQWPASAATKTEVRRSERLLEMGFYQWARAELAPLRAWVSSQDKATKLAAAWRFNAVGDYISGKKLAYPFCVAPHKSGDPAAQQACHPLPEAIIVDRVINAYNIEPFLPYSVMLAESLLKPWVTSHAGARGLMQLMPEVGENLAKEVFPNQPYHPDQLYYAAFNAELGTTELGKRTKSLTGVLNDTSLPAIIASYNGGEAAVRRWVNDFDSTPEYDVFAELIGYAETRRYVRRVLAFIMKYRWTYGDPEP
jgi:soluble lytic murein transglycosylase